MTVEERQLRAWVRTVFHRAALRWLDHTREGQRAIPVGGVEEVMIWQHHGQTGNEESDDPWAATDWLIDCLPRLTARQQTVLLARARGLSSGEIARTVQCDPSTVRRILARVRRECPL